jgi:hypothetical protein
MIHKIYSFRESINTKGVFFVYHDNDICRIFYNKQKAKMFTELKNDEHIKVKTYRKRNEKK